MTLPNQGVAGDVANFAAANTFGAPSPLAAVSNAAILATIGAAAPINVIANFAAANTFGAASPLAAVANGLAWLALLSPVFIFGGFGVAATFGIGSPITVLVILA